MPDLTDKRVLRTANRQYGLVTLGQAAAAGLSREQVKRAIRRGHWQRVQRGVYALNGASPTPERALLAACLSAGGRASHESAAWLWRMTSTAPLRPVITVGQCRSGRLPGVVVHRLGDVNPRPAGTLRRIPCTDARRTLVDLAAAITGRDLDDAVDRALARGVVTVPGLTAEIDRWSRHGRRGPAGLRDVLVRRYFVAGLEPSVLESMTVRLLLQAGIHPTSVELEVDRDGGGGRYRLDIVLADHVAMEVDGYAYHSSPEAMARDHRRRNDLMGAGWTVLVFTWVDVVHHGPAVVDAVRRALS